MVVRVCRVQGSLKQRTCDVLAGRLPGMRGKALLLLFNWSHILGLKRAHIAGKRRKRDHLLSKPDRFNG